MGGGPRTTASVVTVGNAILRAATDADLTAVEAIERACFLSDPWPRESFEAFIGRRGITFLVADAAGREGELAGYAVMMQAADEAELLNLAVSAGFRRRGVGSALLERVLDICSAQSVRAVYLEVREANVAARGLYEAHGFSEVGRRRGYYQRPVEDALILQRVEP